MADISKIQTNGTTYDVKDATARGNAEDALAQSDSASQLANEATDMATAAQSTADSKVSSVNIGTVTTGDEPAVTNSGTDKDVTLDFVFPSLGDARIECGEIEAWGSITLEGMGLVVVIDDEDASGNGTNIFGFGANDGARVQAGAVNATFAYHQITLVAQFIPAKYIAIIAD